MHTTTDRFLANLSRVLGPFVKSAYTVLGEGGGEYDGEGRSLTSPGSVYGQGQSGAAAYDAGGAERYISDAQSRQSAERMRLSQAYVAGAGRPQWQASKAMQAYLREHPSRSAVDTWRQQNAKLLQDFPQLGRFAGHFASNPKAWADWQAAAGLTQPAVSKPTPASPAVGGSVEIKAPAGQAYANVAAQPPVKTTAVQTKPPVPPKPQQVQTQAVKPQQPVTRPNYNANGRTGMTIDEYNERIRRMRTPYRPAAGTTPATAASPAKTPQSQTQPAPYVKMLGGPKKIGSNAYIWRQGQNLPGMNSAQTTAYGKAVAGGGASAAASRASSLSRMSDGQLASRLRGILGAGGQFSVTKTAQAVPAKGKLSDPNYGMTRTTATGARVPVYTDVRSTYGKSVDRMVDARAAQANAARAAATRQVPRSAQNPYDKAYARLPDVVAENRDKGRQQIWEEYARKNGVDPAKTTAQVMKEQAGYKSWGDRFGPGRTYREEGTSTGAIVRNGIRDFRDDFAHTSLNNLNIMANGIQRGAGDVARFAAKWIDPRSWGSSYSAKLNRQAHDNAWDNARKTTFEQDRHILDSMRTGLGTADMMGGKGSDQSWFARLNYGLASGGGQLVGGDAVTGGIGTAAGAASSAIKVPTMHLARAAANATTGVASRVARSRAGQAVGHAYEAIGNARPVKAVAEHVVYPVTDRARYIRSGFGQTARHLEDSRIGTIREMVDHGVSPSRFAHVTSPEAYRAWWARGIRGGEALPADYFSRIAGRVPNRPVPYRMGAAVERGVNEIGNTVAAPFTAASKLSRPTRNIADFTARPALMPAINTGKFLFSPRFRRAAIGYARQHPYRTIGKAVTYPIRYPLGVAASTAKGLLGGTGFWPAYSAGSAAYNAHNGDYGAAAEDVGSMGLFGALGNKAIPLMLGYQLARGMGEDDYEE